MTALLVRISWAITKWIAHSTVAPESSPFRFWFERGDRRETGLAAGMADDDKERVECEIHFVLAQQIRPTLQSPSHFDMHASFLFNASPGSYPKSQKSSWYKDMANKECTWFRDITAWPCLAVALQNIHSLFAISVVRSISFAVWYWAVRCNARTPLERIFSLLALWLVLINSGNRVVR